MNKFLKGFKMKKLPIAIVVIFTSLSLSAAEPQKTSEPIKMSKTKICHAPNSSYYAKTQNFTPYKTLKECLDAGGRLPKR
jgi:hypothetical protein